VNHLQHLVLEGLELVDAIEAGEFSQSSLSAGLLVACTLVVVTLQVLGDKLVGLLTLTILAITHLGALLALRLRYIGRLSD